MGDSDNAKPVIVKCFNCNHEQIGYIRDKKVRIVCERCGVETVSKAMSRRHLQIDMYAPKGQELLMTTEL